MTAQVLTDFFCHEHNLLDVAEQEWELAGIAYDIESQRFDVMNPASVVAFRAARERRSRAWDAYWALKRGYP